VRAGTDKVDKAIERLLRAWQEYKAGGDADELTSALDALTVAHLVSTFEWANGPQNW
jgi:hypothetical protein